MNKLDEIALRVAAETDAKYPWNMNEGPWIKHFARGLLAELSKDAEPSVWTTKSFIGTSTMQDENYPIPLFTSPIPANTAEIEQRVAEAIAGLTADWFDGENKHSISLVRSIREGDWREYLENVK